MPAAFSLICGACGSSAADDVCKLDDADGVVGGDVTFDLTVDDSGFSPSILAAQNDAHVTLILHNIGTKSHSFVIDCLATPNMNGCPTTSCFESSASVPPVAAGASAMAEFDVPKPEGIYYFHSDVDGDTPASCTAGATGCAQFIVK
jgi:hypothetical protein